MTGRHLEKVTLLWSIARFDADDDDGHGNDKHNFCETNHTEIQGSVPPTVFTKEAFTQVLLYDTAVLKITIQKQPNGRGNNRTNINLD